MAKPSLENPENNIENFFDNSNGDDLFKSLTEGQHNDVKIVVEDGEIEASKAILAARSVYFAKMFDKNNQFTEADGTVNIKCSKRVMMKVLEYVYAAKMDRSDLDLIEFMELLDMLRKMLLEEGTKIVHQKILLDLTNKVFPLMDIVKGMKLSME